MFSTLLIANRGEIACRVIRSARALGVKTVAVYSEADADALHVREADSAVEIGPAPAAESYLRVDRLVEAARGAGAEAVHPGYGFLSESPAFARAVTEAGLAWVGPDADTIAALGDKAEARALMARAGLPVNDGGEVADAEEAVSVAAAMGYPVIVKAAAGGGGIGMRHAGDEAELRAAFDTTQKQAARFFGDDHILLERYLADARHVEVQVLGLGDGRVVGLGERDCSVQRRFQKVIEETPSPAVDDELRADMIRAAVDGAQALGYRNAGTFEFLVSGRRFVFLEVNARLQVEHPITEMVTGIDLVAEQLRVAAGEPPGFDPDAVEPSGHAIELRVYAEDPRTFFPSPGVLDRWEEPSGEGIRVERGYGEAGQTVPRFYDPLLAKLCAWGPDRRLALSRAEEAVRAFVIGGVKTNLPFLAEVLRDDGFRRGEYDTSLVSRLRD